MAVTSGFFDSRNGDRKYNADQMSEYFRGIVSGGVFQHLDGGLQVTAGTGLSVNVAAGRAIVQNRWIQNSASLPLSISAASETYGRKDAVVLRLDSSARTVSIVVKTGTPAASPAAPEMTRSGGVYEMALAYVNVAAGATSVTVTDKRSDSAVCGWAAVAQAASGEVDQMLNDMKTGFDGVTYPSPAAMVQGCDTIIDDKANTIIDDIAAGYIPYKIIKKSWVNSSGVIQAKNGYDRTDYIDISRFYSIFPKMDEAISNHCWFFDSSKNPISAIYVSGSFIEREVPATAKYVVFSNTTDYLSTLLIKFKTAAENDLANAITANSDYIVNNAVEARDIRSYVSNEPVYFLENTNVQYYSGDDFRQKIVVSNFTSYITPGESYCLYCGKMDVPLASGVLRILVKYTDTTSSRFDVSVNDKIKVFKTDTEKTIDVIQLIAVPANYGGTCAADGTAVYNNIYLFKGDRLIFREQFDMSEKFYQNLDSSSAVPSYYESQLSTKEETIRGHKNYCSFDGDGLVFMTDPHYVSGYMINGNVESNSYNTNHAIPLIKHILKHTAIPWVFFGGDLMHTTNGIDPMIHSMNNFGSLFGNYKDRLIYCVGNHEYFTDYGQEVPNRPTSAMLYGGYIKSNESRIKGKTEMDTYFFDNEIQKIRYFVISCGRDTETSTTQIAWVLDQFSKVPEGYRIICIGHAFMSDNMASFRSYYGDVMNAMDAINSASTYTFNNVEYDYSNLTNVEAICAITGHTHKDGYLITSGGIPCICTTCDSYALNQELQEGESVVVPRSTGTVDEQAFDVIQFDFTNRKIYCTRIGYGSNREFNMPS